MAITFPAYHFSVHSGMQDIHYLLTHGGRLYHYGIAILREQEVHVWKHAPWQTLWVPRGAAMIVLDLSLQEYSLMLECGAIHEVHGQLPKPNEMFLYPSDFFAEMADVQHLIMLDVVEHAYAVNQATLLQEDKWVNHLCQQTS